MIEKDVIHGQWQCSDDMYETAVCPICGYDTEEPYEFVQNHHDEFMVCPYCGSKMF